MFAPRPPTTLTMLNSTAREVDDAGVAGSAPLPEARACGGVRGSDEGDFENRIDSRRTLIGGIG
jgi:hypothetical protein